LLPSITTTGNLNTGMWFPAADTIAFSEGGVEALRIDSSGNLLVGKTAQSVDTVGGEILSTGIGQFTVNGNFAGRFTRQTSDGDIVVFRKGTGTVGSIGVVSDDRIYIATADGLGLQFDKDNNRIVPCDAAGGSNSNVELGDSGLEFTNLWLSGNATIGGGVYLGGTVAANLLDDYERGTWTPVVSASTAGTSTTAATGEYTRVGGIVCLTGALDWSAATSWAVNNYVTVTGLPFTALYGGNTVGYSNRSYPTTSSEFIGLSTSTECRLICVSANGSRHSDAIRFSLTIMV
jgi:hypothetical protein